MTNQDGRPLPKRCAHCHDIMGSVDLSQMYPCETCGKMVDVTCHHKCKPPKRETPRYDRH